MHRVCGVNFALLALYERAGTTPVVAPQDFLVEVDRPLANRYRTSIEYDTVYCDLDDFLIVGSAWSLRAARPGALAFGLLDDVGGPRLSLSRGRAMVAVEALRLHLVLHRRPASCSRPRVGMNISG